jgi:uncharacterized protein
MSERDGYQHGVPCWVDTSQRDPEAAVAFYERLFGWETENTMPPGSPGSYFVCRLRGRDVAAISSQPPEAPAAAWNTYIWVDDADEAAANVAEAGGGILMEPFDVLDAGRLATFTDPAGGTFRVWQPGTHRGAQLVNEASAWSMSMLNTPDPDGCERFYRAVFGWDTEAFETGQGTITLWRVPGFIGGEPQQPVSREVVAGMAPSGNPAAPAHWSVDFWIDDVDAAAALAPELGGSVTVPPYDVPGFRQAVIADPESAAFTVSRLSMPG